MRKTLIFKKGEQLATALKYMANPLRAVALEPPSERWPNWHQIRDATHDRDQLHRQISSWESPQECADAQSRIAGALSKCRSRFLQEFDPITALIYLTDL
ncbi:MAG TPA: hypothetical protein VG944_08530 [Fimbriimonas sp.]|nr:hypothetical protein [Fimbriimonas sp.]